MAIMWLRIIRIDVLQRYARRSSYSTKTTAATSTAKNSAWWWEVLDRIQLNRNSWTWSTKSTKTVCWLFMHWCTYSLVYCSYIFCP